jgi:hypothetical protein
MPKIVTRQTRIIEADSAGQDLRSALARAKASETANGLTETDRAEAWAEVATLAGAVQRRTRQLAGLGRGG